MLRSLTLTFLASLFCVGAMAAPTIGQPAPDFTGVDVMTGHTVHLSELKGKPVVLEWHEFDCPFIKKFYSTGTMQQLQVNAAKQGVQWISINSSAKGKQGYLPDADTARKQIAAHNGQPGSYLLDNDGTIGHLYEAKTTPHMFVIDEKGILVYMGAIDSKPTADTADIASATNYVTEALAALKAGKPVKTSVTKPYGCFVKY
ncbi:MAG: redoxin domain-containing protein [Rickettsiales bacterium]